MRRHRATSAARGRNAFRLPGSPPPRWKANDLVASGELPFFAGPELPWSDWAMRPSAIALLVEEMERGRGSVVELGSGVSTIVLARAARELGAQLVSIDHDPGWANEIRALLRRERLDVEAAGAHMAALDTQRNRGPPQPPP